MHGVRMKEEGMAEPQHSRHRQSKQLKTLVHVMHLHPSSWSQPSVAAILEDLEVLDAADTAEDVQDRAKRIRQQLILPLADIVTAQSKVITVERRRLAEKEQNFQAVLSSLEAEKNKAVQLYQEETARLATHSQFCDMLLGDLDEMAKTLDRTRMEKKQAEDRVAELEVELQRLVLENEELMRAAIADRGEREGSESVNQPLSECDETDLSDDNGAEGAAESGMYTDDASSRHEDVEGRDERERRELQTQEEDYRGLQCSPPDKASLLESVAIVVIQEGSTSIQMILESGLSLAPHAVLHFCKSLCDRAVLGVSSAILSTVKHSPIGFAYQMY